MKTKKILSCLLAVSMFTASSLSVGTIANAQIRNDFKVAAAARDNTYTGSNKGINYQISMDGFGNLHVVMKPEDYKNHYYKTVVYFKDNDKLFDKLVDNGSTPKLVYEHGFGNSADWTKATVFLYADDDFICEEQFTR